MASVETIITVFLAIIIATSIISTKAKIPYTVVLVFTGVGLAVFSLSSFVGLNQIYDQLVGGGLFVGLILPPLLFESMMDINSNELRAVAKPALGLATIGVLLATVAGVIDPIIATSATPRSNKPHAVQGLRQTLG